MKPGCFEALLKYYWNYGYLTLGSIKKIISNKTADADSDATRKNLRFLFLYETIFYKQLKFFTLPFFILFIKI